MIEALGMASIVFVAGFTWHQARRQSTGGQSPASSMLEAWTNIVIGFSVNFIANILLLPLVGLVLTAAQNFWLGATYTAISVVRQFVIRRFYNRGISK